MSKKVLLSAIAILFVMIGAPKDVMAKKIEYLGHQYDGKVKDKIPNGDGVIDIGGLVVKGVFDGNTISNASFETSWLKYEGIVTFDESDNLTLKAGGVFTKYYYYSDKVRGASDGKFFPDRLTNTEKNNYFETLNTDKVTNNESLQYETINLKIPVELQVPSSLNPPVEITKIIELRVLTSLYDNNIKTILYIVNNNLNDYKDSEGRIWNYEKKERYSPIYKVTYPDGSYASNETKGVRIVPGGNNYIDDYNWEVTKPNGAKFENNDGIKITIKGKEGYYKLNFVDKQNLKEFVEVPEAKLKINERATNHPTIQSWGVSDYSNDELIEIYKTYILPLLEMTDKSTLRFVRGFGDYSKDMIAYYNNEKGFYTQKSLDKESEKEALAKRNELSKKYGKPFVDAIYNGNLKVGMPLKLLVNDASWVTVYKMHVYNGGESGDFKVVIYKEGKSINRFGQTEPGVYTKTYRVWVKNWKITQFRDWTSNDEREFNRL